MQMFLHNNQLRWIMQTLNRLSGVIISNACIQANVAYVICVYAYNCIYLTLHALLKLLKALNVFMQIEKTKIYIK